MCTLFWELHGLAAHQAGNDLVHFRFGTGIVGLVQNGLLLVFLHGGVSLHGRRIHGQSQAEADGNFVKIHCNHPQVQYSRISARETWEGVGMYRMIWNMRHTCR